MIAETDTEDHAHNGGQTVFVRDFAGKVFLLFHYHDLGHRLRSAGPNERIFGGRADEIGRSIAWFVKKNIVRDQYRPVLQNDFFDAAVAVLKQDSQFTHETFLAAVK